MPRKRLSDADKERAKQLALVLNREKEEEGATVQELADATGLGYETVRALLTARSAGPSFFLVADLVRALNLDLADIDEQTR